MALPTNPGRLTALGVTTQGVRESWANWDLTTADGIKVEVKSAAYLQSWDQSKLSRVSFTTRETLACHARQGYAATAKRHADVYVFALLSHTDKPTVNPLHLDQWTFYGLPTATLNERTRSQHSITLRTLQALTAPVTFTQLSDAVHAGSR